VAWPVVRVGDLAEQIRGVTFAKADATSSPGEGLIAVMTATNITENGLERRSVLHISDAKVTAKQRLTKNDVVITASSGSLSVVGRAVLVRDNIDATFGAFCKVLRPAGIIDPNYFAHFFRTPRYRSTVARLAAGANINNLRNEDLENLEIPFPPLPEQRRIASILDQADRVRAVRNQALEQLERNRVALFDLIFGPLSPVSGSTVSTLGALAAKYSDGPFGSNLKSSHYSETGVRVVRLQNIGVGKFVDKDRAFVSEEHFLRIAKHECVPGDVLIGTLGDPNLRACLLPPNIDRAVNKADCIQFRPNLDVVNAEYIVGFLNHPSTVAATSGLVLGQTRGRISMGRLRGLPVPVPDIKLQTMYAERINHLDRVLETQKTQLAKLDELFASLQHRAFRGEL